MASESLKISAKRTVRVEDLFAGPVRDYSIYANQRAIPSIVDGFKPSQRKVIFGTLKKASSIPATGIKVAQLANYVSEVSVYHHGEGSLSGTIVGLAQDYAGANNLNYLKPMGQFGDRLAPGAAADRYIYTDINPIFHKVFPRADDLILEHLEEDGETIEPRYYLPILPNVLINGTRGMGTGFATSILSYNPEDLKRFIINQLKGKKQTQQLVPWFRGYKGTVTRDDATGQVTFRGVMTKVNSTTIRVTELPIGYYHDEYKEHLIKLEDEDWLKSFDSNSTKDGFDFVLTVPRSVGYEEDETIFRKLKLIARETENLTVWLPNGKLRCFKSPEELCEYFVTFRLTKFEERRLAKIVALDRDLVVLNEKLRFIKLYIASSEKFAKKTKAELEALLLAEKFTMIDLLLDIRIHQLTKDRIEKLEQDLLSTQAELDYYRGTTATELYLKDLESLDLTKELQA